MKIKLNLKTLLLCAVACFAVANLSALGVLAQETSIKNIDTNSGDTTISIEKGKKRPEVLFKIVDASAEISGDPNTLRKEARDSWKKACDVWKKELKDLNKQNQVLSMSCNSPDCTADADGTTCKSTGTYKIKTPISQDQ